MVVITLRVMKRRFATVRFPLPPGERVRVRGSSIEFTPVVIPLPEGHTASSPGLPGTRG